jgi:4-amino-4-deoxy-L-arabinose transferase-like glycosyltransferase
LLSAVVFVLLVFSLSTEKRGLYLLPIFPALALMIAALVGKICGWTRERESETAISRRWLTFGQLSIAGLFASVAIALPLVAKKYPAVPPGAVWALATILLLATIASVVFWRQGELARLTLAPAIALALAYLLVVSAVYPAMEGRKSARPFSLRLQEITAESRSAGLPVVSFFLLNLPEHFAYHTRGMYTVESEDPVFTAQHLNRSEKVFAAVDAKFWPHVLPHLERQTFLVDETRLSRMDVWLVVNQEHGNATPLDHSVVPEIPLPTSGTQLSPIRE